MTFGAVESHLSRPPSEPVEWIVWPKCDPDRRRAVKVRAQHWIEARALGIRELGAPDVDGERLENAGRTNDRGPRA